MGEGGVSGVRTVARRQVRGLGSRAQDPGPWIQGVGSKALDPGPAQAEPLNKPRAFSEDQACVSHVGRADQQASVTGRDSKTCTMVIPAAR